MIKKISFAVAFVCVLLGFMFWGDFSLPFMEEDPFMKMNSHFEEVVEYGKMKGCYEILNNSESRTTRMYANYFVSTTVETKKAEKEKLDYIMKSIKNNHRPLYEKLIYCQNNKYNEYRKEFEEIKSSEWDRKEKRYDSYVPVNQLDKYMNHPCFNLLGDYIKRMLNQTCIKETIKPEYMEIIKNEL